MENSNVLPEFQEINSFTLQNWYTQLESTHLLIRTNMLTNLTSLSMGRGSGPMVVQVT
jgi:hypothetical protein